MMISAFPQFSHTTAMAMAPVAMLTIFVLALAGATREEGLSKGASIITRNEGIAASDLARDQPPKVQYLTKQRNEVPENADHSDKEADESAALGAVKSDPQGDVEHTGESDDVNDIGNNVGMADDDERVQDADLTENDEQNVAKGERDNSYDAGLQDKSLDAWEKSHESDPEAEKEILAIPSVEKDPSIWHRSRGFSFGRRASGGWSSRARSSGWFSRRRRSWATRRTTLGRRSWFGRRARPIRQRRSLWSARTMSRRGSTWRQRITRGWGTTRRRTSSRGGWSTRRRSRSSWLRRTATRRGRTWGLRKTRKWGTTRRRTSSKRIWWRSRRTTLRRSLSARRMRSRSKRRRSWIGRKFRRRGRIFRMRVIRRRSTKARRRTFSRRVVRYLKAMKGQSTFNWEGNNNKKSRHYSRKPSVPTSRSGITIGRGYDMREKSKQQVLTDLITAGISDKVAGLLAKGVKLVGKFAEAFLKKNHLNNVEITEQQQKALFKISYARQEAEAKRLTTKYYKTKWSSLHPKIQEILIDLKFRGDLRPRVASAAQLALKAAVKQNNLKMFTEVLKNRSYWPNVSTVRFNQRVKFLEQQSR